MSNQYYYFAASLPLIEFDGKAMYSVDTYLQECQRLLSSGDYVLMTKILKDDLSDIDVKNKFVQDWVSFKSCLKNEMAWFRAEKAKKDPNDYIRGQRSFDAVIIEKINQAWKEPNLLTSQRIIDRLQWHYLDELTTGHFFNFEYLVAYGLKLSLLDRHKEYASTKGSEIFEELQKVHMPLIGQI